MRRFFITMLAVVLTARLGVINYNGHRETYYNKRMNYVCERAQQNGIDGKYWVNSDGCKMYGDYIIAAADWNIHPYGSIVETTRGKAIILDTGDFKDRTTVDIAVTW